MTASTQIQFWPLDRLTPYGRNARTHSAEQVAQVAASIREFGFTNPILVDSGFGVLAGHARLQAASKLGLAEVPVIVLGHLTETQKRAYILVDNRLALNASWDDEMLAGEVAALAEEQYDLDLLGFDQEDLDRLLADVDQDAITGSEKEEASEPPVEPVTRAGDLWLIGKHRLLCGDCRDGATVGQLLDGRKANVAITSPPYASQRVYDATSGFTPIPPADYSSWFREVAANIRSFLSPDGSYFLNIKEHAEDGERSLYVKDLVIAHQRQWGWRFVDEFCWRNTANGVPGGWPNRFKNAWEPVFHFTRSERIKFRPEAVSHESEDVVVYSPDNPKAPSGSGLLGCGADKVAGLARPSNVIEVKAEGGQGDHSAPFPRALVEFFVQAFSDPGDLVFDPFLGSGTSIAAAHILGRTGCGCEISPAYCDLIIGRIEKLTGQEAVLSATGESFSQVSTERLGKRP